ncbi:hypothetical protein GIB67_034082 [Kingdonia uniflora]|uniref:AT-hook motif nuclear-localized protein n=1 Tax=Kingdonia uniflora TaxID=39325 RepID=A0A7J7M690_9MAGN|nr:hypothetical protein GIB67_034082 [Kingdonia uniflora]
MEGGESIVSGFPKNMETDPPEVSEVVVAAPAAPQVINMERSIVEVGMFKKKRGRPRKYAPDGTPLPPPPPPPPSFPSDFSVSSEKRSRGRPPGAANRKKYAFEGDLQLSSALAEFTPHLLTINTGEDLAGKIFSIAQMGPLSICIMSCNGPVSTVTISQPGSSGGTLTYEGRFEILSLKGSFIPSHSDSRIQSTNGGLSISLAGPDGRVIGGVVAGSLIAASPIQVRFCLK